MDCFPGFKSLYVSCTISIPVLIVAAFYPTEGRLYIVAIALFFVVLGRELCMDFVDRAGDAVSFMHRIDERPLAVAAFSSQAIGLLLLVGQAAEPLDILVIILMASLLALAGRYWFKLASHKKAIALMKGQLFVGLYFLSKPL